MQLMATSLATINGELREIFFKHPKTDDGTKNSLKGLIRVDLENGKYVTHDQVSKEEEEGGCLETVYLNGKLFKDYSLSEIRKTIDSTICKS